MKGFGSKPERHEQRVVELSSLWTVQACTHLKWAPEDYVFRWILWYGLLLWMVYTVTYKCVSNKDVTLCLAQYKTLYLYRFLWNLGNKIKHLVGENHKISRCFTGGIWSSANHSAPRQLLCVNNFYFQPFCLLQLLGQSMA